MPSPAAVDDVTPDAGGSPREAPGVRVDSRGGPGADDGVVEALLDATRVLVGVASRGLEQLGDEVTVAQFRLLSVLREAGPSASVEVATRLGAAGSSVTRLADRLEESGHLERHRQRPNRSVVRLELTEAGGELVDRVLGWRRAELARILGQLPPGTADTIEEGMRRFTEVAGRGYGAGPVELQVR
jgi:DNA-binding MarR family transcriptional regulator